MSGNESGPPPASGGPVHLAVYHLIYKVTPPSLSLSHKWDALKMSHPDRIVNLVNECPDLSFGSGGAPIRIPDGGKECAIVPQRIPESAGWQQFGRAGAWPLLVKFPCLITGR